MPFPTKEGEDMENKNIASDMNNDEIIFYSTEDVARMMKCSVIAAREIMRRADFPLIMVGKNMKVSKPALEQWTLERRV